MVQTPNSPNVKRCSFWDFLVPKDSKGSLCSLFKFSNCQRLRVYIARYNVTLFSIVRVIDKGPQSVTNCLSPYGENNYLKSKIYLCTGFTHWSLSWEIMDNQDLACAALQKELQHFTLRKIYKI